MNTYYINYGTGAGNESVEVETLEEAKAMAVEGMQHTGMNVTIEHEGEVVALSQWIGLNPDDAYEYLERFGTSGFYAPWIEY